MSMRASVEAQLKEAAAHYQAGRWADAERLYRGILAKEPLHPIANHNLGVLAARLGRPADGLPHLRAALEASPDTAQYWLSLADALLAAGHALDAMTVLEAGKRKGLSGSAVDILVARARKEMVGNNSDLDGAQLYLAGMRNFEAGRIPEAIEFYRRSIAAEPNFAEAHYNLGVLLQEQGRLEEAAESYRRAISLKPDFDDASNNLASLYTSQQKLDQAIEILERLIAKRPDFAAAHNNLGLAYFVGGAGLVGQRMLDSLPGTLHWSVSPEGALQKDKDKIEQAKRFYRRALEIDPNFAKAHFNLAGALCMDRHTEEGFASFMRYAEIIYGAGGTRSKNPPPHKLHHDEEQRAYLGTIGVPGGGAVNDMFYLAGGERLTGPAVNPNAAIEATEQGWRTNKPQIVVIDDLLTQDALEGMRRFCLGSTIWRQIYDNGYLGANVEHGFTCPLLAQIVDELRTTYPAIFRDHPLFQTWAFKYDSRLKGTGIHADFAAVNVNFWITPDEANLDPKGGGLIVWDKGAPLDWDFQKYNTDDKSIREFLKNAGSKSVKIPYRANRAVIFDSDLFHETDVITFKEGYENRRINVTLLYGMRENHEG